MRVRVVLVAAFAVGAVAVTVPAAAGGCRQPPTDGTGATVELKGVCISPTVLRVDTGSTVTFVNRDDFAHNVSGNAFHADLVRAGDNTQQRFDSAGTYPYTCTLHPGMNGAVVVGDGMGTGAGRVVPVPSRELIAASRSAARPSAPSSSSGIPIPVAIAVAAMLVMVSALATWLFMSTKHPST